MQDVNGIINVYKEKGYTSFDVVAKLRGILKIKKIGHTGTLDPDAEGVLPVCIGNATKLCDFLKEKKKEYEAELILGKSTDTQDMSGEVLNESDNYKNLTEDVIRDTIRSFVGEIYQTPPMYSALKVNGQKLCDLARKGITVERKKRKITIFDIEILKIDLPKVNIRVKCSKGTYIRTLCNDIGEKLGTYGCMGYLLRTGSGQFLLEDSVKLMEIEKMRDENSLDKIIIKTENVLDYKKITVKMEFDKMLLNGNVLTYNMAVCEQEVNKSELVKVYTSQGKFAAIYKKTENDLFKPEKMFLV